MSTSERLTPLGPMPRSDTPCAVGCDDRLLVRRNRLKVGTWRSTSSATTAGDWRICSLSMTLTLAGTSPSRCSVRVGVTVTDSKSVAGASTTSSAPFGGSGCDFSAKPLARTTSVVAAGPPSSENRPSGPVTVCCSAPLGATDDHDGAGHDAAGLVADDAGDGGLGRRRARTDGAQEQPRSAGRDDNARHVRIGAEILARLLGGRSAGRCRVSSAARGLLSSRDYARHSRSLRACSWPRGRLRMASSRPSARARRSCPVLTTVTDAQGRLVPNLDRDQFTILDNGKPQDHHGLPERDAAVHGRRDAGLQRQHDRQPRSAEGGHRAVPHPDAARTTRRRWARSATRFSSAAPSPATATI